MQPVPTDAELLARSHRRRRWIVRITLGSLLVLLLVGLAGLALTSSAMSIDEAKVIYKQLESGKAPLSRAEKLLGKPVFYFADIKQYLWVFTKSSLNDIEVFNVCLFVEKGNEVLWYTAGRQTITGRNAWNYRWLVSV